MSNRSIECRRHVELEATLRLALEAFTIVRFCVPPAQRPTIERAITAIKEALSTKCVAHPEQRSVSEHLEPVAWVYKSEPSFDGNKWHDTFEVTTSKQVALWNDKAARPLYTTPPPVTESHKRTWVGLTDEETAELVHRYAFYGLVEATESKLKAKNERKEKNNVSR